MEPQLEDDYALGKVDSCQECGYSERWCECASDADGAYDRMMEERAESEL